MSVSFKKPFAIMLSVATLGGLVTLPSTAFAAPTCTTGEFMAGRGRSVSDMEFSGKDGTNVSVYDSSTFAPASVDVAYGDKALKGKTFTVTVGEGSTVRGDDVQFNSTGKANNVREIYLQLILAAKRFDNNGAECLRITARITGGKENNQLECTYLPNGGRGKLSCGTLFVTPDKTAKFDY